MITLHGTRLPHVVLARSDDTAGSDGHTSRMPAADRDPIDLEPSRGESITHDARPPMPEPPPVRIVSVADVHLPAATGREPELDVFYVDLLRFNRDASPNGTLAYAAENFSLVFDLAEPPIERDSLVPTMIEVPSLAAMRELLNEREVPHEWIKSLLPGEYSILLQDPAGNWLSLGEIRAIR